MASDKRDFRSLQDFGSLSRVLTLLLVLTAAVAVELACVVPGETFWPSFLLLGILAGAAAAGSFWLPSPGDRAAPPRWACIALAGLFAMPIATEWIRFWDAIGLPLELQLLQGLRNVSLGLAALAALPMCLRLAGLVSFALLLFAAAVTEQPAMPVVLAVYSALASLWLMVLYWHSLGPTALAGGKGLPLTFAAVVVLIGGTAAAGSTLGPRRLGTALAEWLPSSGGTGVYDPRARSGVGDGDEETAGANAETVGFVESDFFVEAPGKTLYDLAGDMFGHARKPRKQFERMVPLSSNKARSAGDRVAESKQPGREFSISRSAPPPQRVAGTERSRALAFVKGRTPIHLRLVAYDRFDGVVLHQAPYRTGTCAIPDGSVWFEPAHPGRDRDLGAANVEKHVIRIGRLDADHLPTPAHLGRFRLGKVNKADFFVWAQDGIVRLDGRKPPRGETWVVYSRVPSAAETAASRFERNDTEGLDIDPPLIALAAEWTAGSARGWAEIDAIVQHLRDGCTHECAARPADDCTDPLRWFLFESQRGPDYLFATAAAVLLRARGYSTRVVSGLYVRPERYDAATAHTFVTAEDLHYWAEVRTTGDEWVVLEPTPGYELLQPRLGFFGLLALAGRWAWSHALLLGGGATLALALWWSRRRWIDWALTAWWRATLPDAPRPLLMRTLWLLERRARLARHERPPGMTPQRWLAQLVWEIRNPNIEIRNRSEIRMTETMTGRALFGILDFDIRICFGFRCSDFGFPTQAGQILSWSRFLRWSAWAAFAPAESAAVVPVDEVRADCLEIVSRWTYYRMRRLARNSA